MPNIDFTTGKNTVRLGFTQTNDVVTNKSTLVFNPQTMFSNSDGNRWYIGGTITVNGVTHSYSTVSGNVSVTISAANTFFNWKENGEVYSFSDQIEHTSDGSKTITVAVDITGLRQERYWDHNTEEWDYRYYSWNVSGSTTVTLETIPRATVPTFSVTQANFNTSVTINLPRKNSSFTHKLWYSFGNLTKQTSGLTATTNVGESTTFKAPNTLMNQIPNATEGVCTLYVETYNGTELIGSAQTATIKLLVPSSVKPTISGITTGETVSGLNAKFGAFVQNKSNIQINVNASGSYSSTVANYSVTVNGSTFKTNPCTTGIITGYGNIPVTVTVTDSRGRNATGSYSISVLQYERPKITGFSAYRINTEGTEDSEGVRIGVDLNYNISSVNNLNDRRYTVKYRLSTSQTYTNVGTGTAEPEFNNSILYTSTPVISIDSAYVVRFELTDYFETVYSEVSIPTAFTILDFKSNGLGVAIGKVCEGDRFEVGMNTYFGKPVQFARESAQITTASELNAFIDRSVSATVFGVLPLAAYVSINAGVMYHNTFIKVYCTATGTLVCEAIDESRNLWTGYRASDGTWSDWEVISSGGATYANGDDIEF